MISSPCIISNMFVRNGKRFFSRLYSCVIPFASLGYVLGNKKSERAIMLTLL